MYGAQIVHIAQISCEAHFRVSRKEFEPFISFQIFLLSDFEKSKLFRIIVNIFINSHNFFHSGYTILNLNEKLDNRIKYLHRCSIEFFFFFCRITQKVL